jgi:hypothetical protein
MANIIKESISIAAKLIKDNPGENCIETYYMIDEALDGRSVVCSKCGSENSVFCLLKYGSLDKCNLCGQMIYSDETTDEEFKKDKSLVQMFFKFIKSMN